MALPLRVFILGVPNCKPNAREFSKCPMSGFGWAGSGGGGGGPIRNPSTIWSCSGKRWGWLSQGNPPSVSQKGYLLVALFGIPAPWWVSPRHWCRAAGGAFNSQSVISWWRSSSSWCSSWLARLPRSTCRWCGISPLGWGLSWGEWGSPSSSEGGGWDFEDSPPTAIIYALTWASEGATALTAMASSHCFIALTTPCVVCCISSVEQNRVTNSVAE